MKIAPSTYGYHLIFGVFFVLFFSWSACVCESEWDWEQRRVINIIVINNSCEYYISCCFDDCAGEANNKCVVPSKCAGKRIDRVQFQWELFHRGIRGYKKNTSFFNKERSIEFFFFGEIRIVVVAVWVFSLNILGINITWLVPREWERG